jgi:hypothetical protein
MNTVTNLITVDDATNIRTADKVVSALSVESGGVDPNFPPAAEPWFYSAFFGGWTSSVLPYEDFAWRGGSVTTEVRFLHRLTAQEAAPEQSPREMDRHRLAWPAFTLRPTRFQATGDVGVVIAERLDPTCATSWRFQRPRMSLSKRRANNVFLDETRRATTPRSAYSAFERLLRRAEAGERQILDAMVGYIGDTHAPFKATLLSCIADREMVLTNKAILWRLTALLGAADIDVARAAAQALVAGGDASCEALDIALSSVSDARREELQRFLSFASDL